MERVKAYMLPSLPGIVFLFALILRIIHLEFPFGDYDEGVYIATVRSILHGFPVFSHTYISQPPLLYFLSLPIFALTHSILFLRLIPVAFSLLAIVLSFLLVRKYIGLLSAYIVAVYLACNGIFLEVSRTFQHDMLWVGATMLCLYLIVVFHEKKDQLYLIFAGLAFGMSLMFKANPTFLVLLLAYLPFVFTKDIKKDIADILLFILATILFISIVVSPMNWGNLYHLVVGIRTGGFSFQPFSPLRLFFFRHEVVTILFGTASIFLFCKEIIHVGKIREVIDRNMFVYLSLVWLIASFFFFVIYNPLFMHHLVFTMMPLALVASLSLQKLWERVKMKSIFLSGIYILFILVILVFVMFYRVTIFSFVFPSSSAYTTDMYSLSKYIDSHSATNGYIITDNQILLYLANRNTTPGMVDTSFVRIETKNLSASYAIAQTNDYHVRLVILQSGRLSQLPDYLSYLQSHFREKDMNGAEIFER